ncbi:MAG: phosphoenolpyruvate--protein phosphotransferase [Acidobacteriota bacterium]
MDRLTGIGVSPGIAVGRAVILTLRTEVVRFPIPSDRVAREVAALHAARDESQQQLRDIRKTVWQARGHELAAIFDAQILMLEDAAFIGRAEDIIRSEHVNAGWAVHRAYEELAAVFVGVEDAYLRERDNDVADVAGRVRMNLRHLGRGPRELLRGLDGPSVLVADELTASLAAQLDWTRIRGFAVDAGSRTYHTAILARSLKVPAVVGLHDASTRIIAGTPIILDGDTGEVTVGASAEERDEALQRASARVFEVPGHDTRPPQHPLTTADGVRVRLQANVELLEDLRGLREQGVEGVGLYRSEFMLSGHTPASATEDDQYALYRSLIESVAPHPVTVRTFDLDERQLSPEGPVRGLRRPGRRGIRLGLAHADLLRTQLKALVRASTHGPLRIMLPFVTGVEELRAVKGVLRDVCLALQLPAPDVGVMVEVPAAALIVDLLAPEVSFLTIGTNDLIQYCLAVDRTDDRVSTLYEPLHPAVLRLLRHVRRQARRHGIPVSICGEMASEPGLLELLVGLGLTDFSMTPTAIPMAHQVIRALDTARARAVARRALSLHTAADIERSLRGPDPEEATNARADRRQPRREPISR